MRKSAVAALFLMIRLMDYLEMPGGEIDLCPSRVRADAGKGSRQDEARQRDILRQVVVRVELDLHGKMLRLELKSPSFICIAWQVERVDRKIGSKSRVRAILDLENKNPAPMELDVRFISD